MTRVYKPKSKREQLESFILEQIQQIRKRVDPKALKQAQVRAGKKAPSSLSPSEKEHSNIPLDTAKNKKTIELFLKMKASKKPLH